MNQAAVERFLDETAAVEGWFFPIDALLFGAFDEMQRALGVVGDAFEIGVHHGKSAILLGRLLRDDERLGVCDVFEQQEANVDHSGEGSRHLFLENMQRFAPAAARGVRVFAKRSDALTTDETTTSCRLFHIDGGHRPEDVMGDLRIAREAVGCGGIVIVDDVFNPSWPGVGEGVHDFMRAPAPGLVPLVIGGNKAYFAKPGDASMYDEPLARLAAGAFVTTRAFTFERKRWLGRDVWVASRRDWVDLHPMAAAMMHLR